MHGLKGSSLIQSRTLKVIITKASQEKANHRSRGKPATILHYKKIITKQMIKDKLT